MCGLPTAMNRATQKQHLYSVTMEPEQGESYITHPIAIAELGDNDNHHFLCLDTDDKASG